MLIFPAIDLYDGKAVRLYKGDYANMTVYSDNPLSVARDFEAAGDALPICILPHCRDSLAYSLGFPL